ncbi:MAG: hypothetical protein ABIP68_08385 [Ferruginibacter sp.]
MYFELNIIFMFLRFILMLALLNNCAFAQEIIKTQSLPYPGSGPYTSEPDAFSFSANPAALSNYKENLIGVFSERKFLMEENSLYALYLGIPSKHGNFGFFINYSGFSNFNQFQVGGAYGKNLGKFSAGIQFNYYKTKIFGYGNENALSASVGLLFKINSQFYTGVQISNFVQGKLSSNRQPKIIKFGFGYQPSASVFVSMDILKEENISGNVLMLLRYNYNKRFHSGLSFNAGNITASCFAGISWNNYRIDISAGYHQHLGISPGVTLFTKL